MMIGHSTKLKEKYDTVKQVLNLKQGHKQVTLSPHVFFAVGMVETK